MFIIDKNVRATNSFVVMCAISSCTWRSACSNYLFDLVSIWCTFHSIMSSYILHLISLSSRIDLNYLMEHLVLLVHPVMIGWYNIPLSLAKQGDRLGVVSFVCSCNELYLLNKRAFRQLWRKDMFKNFTLWEWCWIDLLTFYDAFWT